MSSGGSGGPDDPDLSAEEIAALARLIPGLGGAPPGAIRAERLGGFTNHSWRLRWGGVDVAARRRRSSGAATFAPRPAEVAASRRAHALGLAPELILAQGPWVVTRFVDGARPLTGEDLRDPGRLASVAGALRRWHDSPPLGTAASPGGMASAALEAARGAGVAIPEALPSLAPAFAALEARLAEGAPPPRPCHFDPSGENWLVGDGAVHLIDWEYAGDLDPLWDLADLAQDLGLDPPGRRALLAAWWGGSPPPGAQARMEALHALAVFTWAPWCLAMSALPSAHDFRGFALGSLERAAALLGPALAGLDAATLDVRQG